MRKLICLFSLVLMVYFCQSCANSGPNQPDVNVTSSINPSDGLDLKLVGALLQNSTCKDADDLEKEINKDGGINNLDLNGDGKIDYINVTENDPKGSTAARSFDLTTGKADSITHIATIDVQKAATGYQVNMSGNQQIYGNDCNYSTTLGDMLLFNWMFMPRSLYYHPYYYGSYYPSYYGAGYMRPMVVSPALYQQRTVTQRTTVSKTVVKSTSPSTSTIKSSNAGKVSNATRTSINNNSSSSKSFSNRNSSSPVSKGGFTGKSSSSSSGSSSKSSSSGRSSFGSSSHSSSGGSHSSSGGGRRCDGTFKEDINTLAYNDAILKLNPVTFYYKDKQTYGSEKQIGFIAQDVQKHVPEAVYKDEKGLMMDYTMLIPMMVKEIQRQNAEITQLQEQIKKMRK